MEEVLLMLYVMMAANSHALVLRETLHAPSILPEPMATLQAEAGDRYPSEVANIQQSHVGLGPVHGTFRHPQHVHSG